MRALIENLLVACPYCGESMETDVDCTGGDQTYYEDCQVCCMPIRFHVIVDAGGELASLTTSRDDE